MKIGTEDNSFLDIIKARIPERKELVNILEELLHMEREAIYRRLRGQVPFSFGDIAKISKRLDISVDNIIGIGENSSIVRPGRITYIDFLNPSEAELDELRKFNDALSYLQMSDDSEFYCAANILPQFMYITHEYIYKYYLFKWKFQAGYNPRLPTFSKINASPKLIKINSEYKEYHKYFKSINLILDRNIFTNIVNDIKYFEDTGMIRKDEVEILKEDLLDFVKELENGMITSIYEDCVPFNIYISNINLEAGHTCIKINERIKISMLKSFSVTDTAAVDHVVYEKMYKWMESLIRTSTMVSGSGSFERLQFIRKQRDIINQL